VEGAKGRDLGEVGKGRRGGQGEGGYRLVTF